MPINPNPKPYRGEPINLSRKGNDMSRNQFRNRNPFMQPRKPEQPKPFWSAEQWEEWATNIYLNLFYEHYTLPDWFIQKMESESDDQDNQQ